MTKPGNRRISETPVASRREACRSPDPGKTDLRIGDFRLRPAAIPTEAPRHSEEPVTFSSALVTSPRGSRRIAVAHTAHRTTFSRPKQPPVIPTEVAACLFPGRVPRDAPPRSGGIPHPIFLFVYPHFIVAPANNWSAMKPRVILRRSGGLFFPRIPFLGMRRHAAKNLSAGFRSQRPPYTAE